MAFVPPLIVAQVCIYFLLFTLGAQGGLTQDSRLNTQEGLHNGVTTVQPPKAQVWSRCGGGTWNYCSAK